MDYNIDYLDILRNLLRPIKLYNLEEDTGEKNSALIDLEAHSKQLNILKSSLDALENQASIETAGLMGVIWREQLYAIKSAGTDDLDDRKAQIKAAIIGESGSFENLKAALKKLDEEITLEEDYENQILTVVSTKVLTNLEDFKQTLKILKPAHVLFIIDCRFPEEKFETVSKFRNYSFGIQASFFDSYSSVCFYEFAVKGSFATKEDISGSIEMDNRYYIDGTFSLDGSKNLNAYLVKEYF